MIYEIEIDCPTCNGDGFVSTGDRHCETAKDVCPQCRGKTKVPAKTGQGPESSSGGTESLYANDRLVRAAEAVQLDRLRWGNHAVGLTRLTQLHRYDRDKGVAGDCMRTVLACMLGLDRPDRVPHFMEDFPPDGVFHDRVAAWLGERGYKIFQTAYHETNTVQDVMRTVGMLNPGVYYMLSGASPRGTQHVVICLGDALWHDTHPDGGGIVGPDVDGFYRVEVLVPTVFSEFRRPRGHEDLPPVPDRA